MQCYTKARKSGSYNKNRNEEVNQMQQADIGKVRASVHQQCGRKVLIQLDKGRNKVDIQEGVIQGA